MKMRKRPTRGEKYHLSDGTEVTVLEVLQDGRGEHVNCILPSGRTTAILKDDLDLPIIDTSNYEKLYTQ